MTQLSRGQNAPLSMMQFDVDVSGVLPGTVDLMVFQVTATGKVRTDADLVFVGQPASVEGALRFTGPSTVAVDLARVPAAIEMLRVAVCLDGTDAGSLARIGALGVSVGGHTAPALGLTTERAAVLAEIYRRGGQWKVRNVSAGWDAGRRALVTEHGVTFVDAPAPRPVVPPPVTPRPTPPPPQYVPSAPPARPTKVVLSKAQPTVSLAKGAEASGTMRVNLNWTQRRGLFGGKAIDLDLACLYEMRNGNKGVVQALGNSFGNLKRAPYIHLDGDDRTGSVSGGENLHINLEHITEFTRILIFAYIYEGSTNWSAADGVVTLYPPHRPEVEVRLDSHDNRARSCAVALLRYTGGELTVTREVHYINGFQEDVSNAYQWGMRWKPGRK